MAHSDWMKDNRIVGHKINIATYRGPRSKIDVCLIDSDFNKHYFNAFNNVTTEHNISSLSTNYGSGKNVGFFDGENSSIHLNSETLSYNLYNPYILPHHRERANSRYCSNFVTDANGNISGVAEAIITSAGPYGVDVYSVDIDYFPFIISPLGTNAETESTTRYLQISGNSNTNDFPVDFDIINIGNREKISIVGNSKVDFIMDFGGEVDITSGLYVKVYKWSKPYSSVKFTYIGYDVTFDASDILRNYEVDNGCLYDGGDRFSYGVKVNSGKLCLYKDKNNSSSFIHNGFKDICISGSTFKTNNTDDSQYIDGELCHYRSTSDLSRLSVNLPDLFVKILGDALYEHFYLQTTADIYLLVSFKIKYESSTLNRVFAFAGVEYNEVGYGIIHEDGDLYKLSPETSYPDCEIFDDQWKSFSFVVKIPLNTIHDNDQYDKLTVSFKFYDTDGSTDTQTTFYVKDFSICGSYGDNSVLTELYESGKRVFNNTVYTNMYHDIYENYVKNGVQYVMIGEHDSIPNYKAQSKISSIINSDISNVQIAVSTIGDSNKLISNMWIVDHDYDMKSEVVNFTMNDIFGILKNITYDGSGFIEEPYNEISSYCARILQNSFMNNVDLKYNLKLASETFLNFRDNFNIRGMMSVYNDKIGENYFNILNDASCATNTFIIQDHSYRGLEFIGCSKEFGTEYNITDAQCYDISDRRNEKNSIKQIELSPVKISSQTEGGDVVYSQPSFTTSTFKAYLSADKTKYSQVIMEESYIGKSSIEYPYIAMDTIELTGTFTIPLSEFNKYQHYSAKLRVATAYRETYIVLGVLHVDGERADGVGQPRQYMINSGDSTTTTTSLNSVTHDDVTIVNCNNSISIEEKTSSTVTLRYRLSLNPEISFESIFGKQYYSYTENGVVPHYIQKYIGAYSVIVYGRNNEYDSSSLIYGENTGTKLTIPQNTFIQQDGYVYGHSSQNLPQTIAEDIYAEYSKGKKIAKIDYIGSPYLKVYDIITLDNGIKYRLLQIKNISNGGGFKQQLILMEKEN